MDLTSSFRKFTSETSCGDSRIKARDYHTKIASHKSQVMLQKYIRDIQRIFQIFHKGEKHTMI
jgi:hypothetical protein